MTAVCIVSSKTPTTQTIEDLEVVQGDDGQQLTELSSAPAFLVAGAGELEAHSAELAALAVWSGRGSVRLADGSEALSREAAAERGRRWRAAQAVAQPGQPGGAHGKLERRLLDAELLSWRSWLQHPVRSAVRLVPLRIKESVNRAAGRTILDLSFYLQFQPRSLKIPNALTEPLCYRPRATDGRKRVALVTPHLGPGGAEAVLQNIASTLRTSRFETLLLATHSGNDEWLKKWQTEHVYDLARVVSPERMVAAVCSVVANWRCDYVLVQNSLYGYAALPHIKRRLPQIKAIDVIHNIDPAWDLVAVTAEVAGELDLRIAVSDAVRRRLVAAGTPEQKIRLAPSGVDLERFRPRAAEGCAAHEILFAGRLDPVKRPLLLVEIAARLAAVRKDRDFRLIVAGDGPEKERVCRGVARAGLENVFDFRGQVEDLAPLLASSEVVVLPSRSEGLPLVVLEALACGRPVVASNVGAIGEALDASCGVLIDAGSDEAGRFASALNDLLDQPERRAALGAAGRRRMESGYDLRQARQSYARLFD